MHRKRCGRQRTRTRSNALRFSAATRWKHRADKQEREGKEHGEGRRSKDPHPDVLPRSTQGNLLRSSLRSGGTLRRAETFSRESGVRTPVKHEKPQDRMSDATSRRLCGGANRRGVEKTRGRNMRKGPQPFFRWNPGNRAPGVDSADEHDEEASLATPREDVLLKRRTATIRMRRNRRREGRRVVLQAYKSVCENPTDERLRRGGSESFQKSGRQL